jgi:catechol 2,3-dioxygenase-like lactoylglutathione lyase family enzyme
MADALKIGMVMLGAKNMAESVAFYRDKVGFAVQFESPNFTFLNAGNVTLVLNADLVKHSPSTVGALELVMPVANVTAAYTALKQRGTVFTHEPHQVTPTDWAANFDDPSGHHLSVFGPKGD